MLNSLHVKAIQKAQEAAHGTKEENKRVNLLVSDDYKISFEYIGKMILEKQKGIKYSIGEISNWVSKLILSDTEIIARSLEACKYEHGTRKIYKGLVKIRSIDLEEFVNSITKADIYKISYELDKKCIREIQECEWTVENLNKFRQDMIIVGRLYQEKTIDYAKKISLLDIVESPMKKVICLSLKQMVVKLTRDGKIDITLPYADSDLSIVCDDAIHQTRVAFANEYKTYVEGTIIPSIIDKAQMPEIMREQFDRLRYSGDLKVFSEAKRYYKDIVGNLNYGTEQVELYDEGSIDIVKENFKSDKARIQNMIRIATQHMTPEQRGAHMKYVAGLSRGDQKREDGTENRFYLSLCREEFVLWLMSMGLNEMDFTGFKLIGNKGYEEGDMVYFENGQADKAILDGFFTGWTTIKSFGNVLYATVDIQDSLVVPEITNEILVKVNRSFVKKYGPEKVMAGINRGTDVEFFAGNGKFTMDVTCPDKVREVAYDYDPIFAQLFKGCTGKIVKTSIVRVKTDKDTYIEDVYVSVNLDTIPMSSVREDIAHIEDIDFVVVESDEI